MDTEARLQALEKKLHLHKFISLATAAALFVSLAFWALRPVPKIIVAEKYELRDSGGNMRGVWGMRKEGPIFALLDEKEILELGLTADNIGSSFIVFDAHGKGGIQIGLTRTGKDSAEEPGIYLRNKNGKARLALMLKSGEPYALLLDQKEKTHSRWGMSPEGPFLSLRDPSRKRGIRIGFNKKGAGLYVNDKTGKTRFFPGS